MVVSAPDELMKTSVYSLYTVYNLQNKKVVRRFGEFVSCLPVIVTAFEGILAYGTENKLHASSLHHRDAN